VLVEHAAAIRIDRVRGISFDTAQWIARIGRVGAIWLPIWLVCAAARPVGAFAASLVFLLIWKAAFRHAYADASLTVWTVGAGVPAVVGGFLGGLLAAPLTVWVPPLHVGLVSLVELTGAAIVASALWEKTVTRSLAARRRVLLVGIAGGGSELLEEIALAPGLPFEVIGVVDDERHTDTIAGVPLLGVAEDLPRIVEQYRPKLVILANDSCRGAAFDSLVDIGHLGFSVVGLPAFYEYAFGRLPVRSLTPEWFMSILDLYRKPYSQLAKRTFDLSVAAVALLIVAPVIPLLVLLVRRTPGPVIFRQVRLGEGGKAFTIYKFRTMRQDAEKEGALWAMEHDPRVTRAGRFMRKTRLDELPQLWNVIRGEMSIVGPRPERPEFVADLVAEVPFWQRRHLAKPGITGWAQIRRGYTADCAGTADKLSYDLWYLRHRSLVVDLAILVRTFSTLLTGFGAR
jgi:exopolysaccharide biosynthesis polyprenyl glycosylphosphotransferase